MSTLKLAAGAKFQNKEGHFYQVVSVRGGKIHVRIRKGPRGPYAKELVEVASKDFKGMKSLG